MGTSLEGCPAISTYNLSCKSVSALVFLAIDNAFFCTASLYSIRYLIKGLMIYYCLMVILAKVPVNISIIVMPSEIPICVCFLENSITGVFLVL